MPQKPSTFLRFFLIKKNQVKNYKNSCYLVQSDWDDFGFKTCFNLTYLDNELGLKDLGTIYILKKGQSGYIILPSTEFLDLDENYCSLGGSQGYYEDLMGLEENIRFNILKSLRDCVFNPKIFDIYKAEPAMGVSFLRHTNLSTVTKLYPSILRGNIALTPYEFYYIINEKLENNIVVSVVPWSNPPTNIHVLIGRNGVGKTRILSGIVDELTKNKEPNPISQKGKLILREDQSFTSSEPHSNFTNLVAVVFSAFDNFKPIRNNEDKDSIPCEYIGLKKLDGITIKSLDDLKNDFSQSIKKCFNSQRKKRWVDAINILNSDPIFKNYQLETFVDNFDTRKESELYQIFDLLSSGHKIILLTITRLVELVDEKTLVLIDEPENHLHPPLLSSFVRAISDLLIKRNAVALIATHSPIVIQEIPKSCVTKIDRVNSLYTFQRPIFETYAENIDTLTRDIFRLELEDSGFYKTLSDYINEKNCNYEELLAEFEGNIGSEGRLVALALIQKIKDSNA